MDNCQPQRWKRQVVPAIPWLTVRAERRALAEIRAFCGEVPTNFVLSNGMNAEEFSLCYILGHQLKRKGRDKGHRTTEVKRKQLYDSSLDLFFQKPFDTNKKK